MKCFCSNLIQDFLTAKRHNAVVVLKISFDHFMDLKRELTLLNHNISLYNFTCVVVGWFETRVAMEELEKETGRVEKRG